MKSNFKSVLKAIGLLLLGVSLTACTVEPHKKESGINTVPVTVGRVQTVQDRETISVSGTVSTSNSPASVCFLVSGKVVSVGPREGEYVKQGQVLARIDPTDFNLSIRGVAAQAASAQAAMEKALRPARPELLEQARIGFERAEDEYRRMKMLYDAKSLAQTISRNSRRLMSVPSRSMNRPRPAARRKTKI